MNELDKLAGNMNDDDRDGMDDKEIGKNIYFLLLFKSGTIQIICDTFLAYFIPDPSLMCHFVKLAWAHPSRCVVTFLFFQKK